MKILSRASRVRRWLLLTLAMLCLVSGGLGLNARGNPGAEGAAPAAQATRLAQADDEAPPADADGPPIVSEPASGDDDRNDEAAEPAAADEPGGGDAPASASAAGRRSAMPSGANVAIIQIDGMIHGFHRDSIERRVERARNEGANVIVFELHTDGGTVPAAMEISGYIKTLPEYTVAWVNRKAYSAGILIASATDELVMARHSVTGDCAPIVPGQELAPSERAKALSPILEEFRDNAAANGYDYALFQAMCVLGVEAHLVEHNETGEQRIVNQVDYSIMVRNADPDEVRDRLADFSMEERVGMAGIELAGDEDAGQWRHVRTIHDGNTLLTVSDTRAMEAGLATAIVSDQTELRQHLGAASLAVVSPTWSEQLVSYLTHPMVRMVLVIALLLGAYIEFQTPGVGIAGGLAFAALVALLGAPFIVGLAEVWHVVVFLIGLVLLIVELMFMAGFGLIGVLGIILMFIGLVMAAVPTGGGGGFGPVRLPPQQMWGEVLRSSLYLMAGVFVSFVGFYFLTKHFGRLPGLSRLVLSDAQPAMSVTDGTAMPMPRVSGDEAYGEGRILPGDTGEVVIGLRPTGRAQINGQIVDVVSLGHWVERGAGVKVVEVHGNRIVVNQVE